MLWIYAPHWAPAKYEGEWVEFPPYEPACYEDPAWGANPDADARLRQAARADLEGRLGRACKDKWPGAYKAIEAFKIDNDEMGAMIAKVDLDGRRSTRGRRVDGRQRGAGRWRTQRRTRWSGLRGVGEVQPGMRPAAPFRVRSADARRSRSSPAAASGSSSAPGAARFLAGRARPRGDDVAARPDRRRCATSASTSAPARSSSSWASPAPASRRWCAACRGWSSRPPARSSSTGRDLLARLRARADRAAPAPHGHGVPALRAAAAPHGARQRRLPARDPGRRARRSASARAREMIELVGLARPRGQLPAPALRRPAAARRHRPLARGRARALVPRRAVLGARPADPPRDAERVPAPADRCCRRRSSSSPTISTRRSASPTASPSCGTAGSSRSARPEELIVSPGRRLRRRIHPRRAAREGS